nr:hypothetical protein [Deltaproteobacteria bacterium]
MHPLDGAADGSFGGALPAGDWELRVHDPTRPPAERVPITVTAEGAAEVALAIGRPGTLQFAVTDEIGRRVPAKVTLFRQDRDPVGDPALGD